MTQLTPEALTVIQKLYGYYQKWSEKWRNDTMGVENLEGGQGGSAVGGEAGAGAAPPPPVQA